MKAYSLLPDTHIIADPCGRVMDKIRIFCEGIVNDILENASIFEREKQPAACRIGSKSDPIPHWRAEKCFFRCTCPRKKRIAIYFPADRRENSAEGFFSYSRGKHLNGKSTKPPRLEPRRFCVLFEREKREGGF